MCRSSAIEACTASGLARVALKTGAAVLPGFLVWEEAERQYVLRFGPELELADSGDSEADAATNTALFTGVIEETHPAIPLAVAVDAPPLEDAPARRATPLLERRIVWASD